MESKHGCGHQDMSGVFCLGCVEEMSQRLAEREKEIERLREALHSCQQLDRSKEYEYGEADRQGNKPGVGQRFKTPNEIAKAALGEKRHLGRRDEGEGA